MSDWPFGSLCPLKYSAILIDPPWSYKMRSTKGYGKSPEAHYATLSDETLASLPVAHLAAPDCFLFMWAVWPKLDFAIRLMEGWGFTYKTGGSWEKTTITGKTSFGPGYILRTACEPFIVGTLGEPRTGSKSVRNFISSLRREHSRKPPEMRSMVEALTPRAFRCELFAREAWPGNEVWGAESSKFNSPQGGEV